MIHTNRLPPGYGTVLAEIDSNWILSRIWSHDYTVWSKDPTEIVNRLGWLHAPESMRCHLGRLNDFAKRIRAEGVEHVLLLGMGGSSLAPEMLARTFGPATGFPPLTVLDSTHPDAVLRVDRQIDWKRTLVLVATKSGTTTETLSLFRYFYARAAQSRISDPGSHFVAITDPGSPLVKIATEAGFRETFLNDANIGGRYAALSLFGLVPAALLGLDPEELLDSARDVAIRCAKYKDLESNPSIRLAVWLAAWSVAGRDKATFVISDRIAAFGDWVEQLIAESTGKDGKGILPVVGERVASPKAYADDRVFIHLRHADDDRYDAALAALDRSGHPVARIDIRSIDALGTHLFLWELAIAIAGHILRINPFDQPNVESAKSLARHHVSEFLESGSMPGEQLPAFTEPALRSTLSGLQPGDYAAIHAYMPPSPSADAILEDLRTRIRDEHRVATTVGYGPRFLHSTGQLHKGGRRNGRFVQIVAAPSTPLPIPLDRDSPGRSLTFEALIQAQAQGDRSALEAAGQRVTAFALEGTWDAGIPQREDDP